MLTKLDQLRNIEYYCYFAELYFYEVVFCWSFSNVVFSQPNRNSLQNVRTVD